MKLPPNSSPDRSVDFMVDDIRGSPKRKDQLDDTGTDIFSEAGYSAVTSVAPSEAPSEGQA